MSRARMLVAVLGATVVTAGLTAGASGLAQASPRPAEKVLAGSTVPFTRARPTGAVPGSLRLTIQLWLRPDMAAAERFAAAVSTPGTALFRHYLGPAAYTARFAASAATARQAESWLRTEGFTGITADSGRNYVRATASVSKINAAFRVRLLTYPGSASAHAVSVPLHANNRPVSLPASLAGHVLAVTGLDNAAPLSPYVVAGRAHGARGAGANGPDVPCSHYYGQEMATGLPQQFGVTSFPTFVCGYSALQMRSAYGANWVNTGKGQTIALIEQGLTRDMFLTLQDYARANHMPAPSTNRYEELSLGKNTCGDPFNIEEQLDVESSYDMAPGANQLVVGGDSCDRAEQGNQAEYDADIAVIDGTGGHPLASVASNSWESGTESQPLFQTRLVHAYLVRGTAEGVGMYFSAGDGSGVLEPSIDPNAIAVGGTTLGIGSSGQRLFETGWSTGASQLKNNAWNFVGEDGASGGGPSVHWVVQPDYQKGVVPASLGTSRSAPDLAADADPFTGINVGMLKFGGKKPVFFQESIGGTSESSPLVAGMVTAAQQGQKVPFGFINPAIYKLTKTSAFYDTLPLTAKSNPLYRGVECDLLEFFNICLGPKTSRIPSLTTFDDQNPHMAGYTGQVTLPGYDNMTGLGVPNGQAFIAALRKLG